MTVVKPFPQFGVVSDFSDHHYAESKISISAAVSEKIKEEWKDLEEHLPDSIFVRAYKDRVDLLRAVIVGAKGTPYHDGLYFFDISFPTDYPARPPLLRYRSFGLEINPNLHADGKVCLRLANTWPGRKATEEWNPKSSTVLQVLLSIQALVLNEKPYFNEPGREILQGWNCQEEESESYSGGVFVLSLKTMERLLSEPPKHFEAFVVSHFKERDAVISAACRAYVNGRVRIGHYCADDSAANAHLYVSRDFKCSMAEQYRNFVSSLERCVAEAEAEAEKEAETETEAEKEAETEAEKEAETETEKIGIGRRVWGKLKKVLGLKSKKENVERT